MHNVVGVIHDHCDTFVDYFIVYNDKKKKKSILNMLTSFNFCCGLIYRIDRQEASRASLKVNRYRRIFEPRL